MAGRAGDPGFFLHRKRRDGGDHRIRAGFRLLGCRRERWDVVLRPTSLIVDPNRPDRVWVLQRAYHSDRNTNTIGITQRIISDDTVRWVGVATFTAPATVDNFEGIAAVRRPDGGVRLYILSDDNFNPDQRMLLLAFDVR